MINPAVQDWLRTMCSLAKQDRAPEVEAQIDAKRLAKVEAAAARVIPSRRDEAEQALVRVREAMAEKADCTRQRRDLVADGIALLPALRRARIFDLSPDIQRICGRKCNEMIGAPDLSALPFPVCWFNIRQWGADYKEDERIDINANALGLLATRDGVTAYVFEDHGDVILIPTVARTEEGWDPAGLQTAWGAHLMAAVVNGHVAAKPTRPRPGYALQRELAKLRAAGVTVALPDLYELTLNARQAAQQVRLAVEAHSGPAYRYEVRQHERMLVHRGRWPCGDELREDFATRGYVVERGDSLDERAAIGLDLRGLPAGERHEWIAWRFARVREHEAGPKDAPLRRAVRVAT